MCDTTHCGVHAAIVGTTDNGGASELTRRRPNKRPQKQQRAQNDETTCGRQKVER